MEDLLTVQDHEGTSETFDLDKLSENEAQELFGHISAGKLKVINKKKTETKDWNKIPYPENEYLRRGQGALTSGAVGLATGGPWGGIIGGTMGAISPPKTISDLVMAGVGGKAIPFLSKAVGGQGGMIKEGLKQAGLASAGALAQDKASEYFNMLFDPNSEIDYEKLRSIQPNDLIGMGLGGLFGGIGGAIGSKISDRVRNSPTSKATQAFNLGTGEDLNNPQFLEAMKDIEVGKRPNSTLLADPRNKVLKQRDLLQNEINKEQQFKSANQSQLAEEGSTQFNAKRQNREETFKTKVEQAKLDPELDAAHQSYAENRETLDRIAKLEDKVKSGRANNAEISMYDELKDRKDIIAERVDQSQAEIQRIIQQKKEKALDVLARNYESTVDANGNPIAENVASREAGTQAYKEKFQQAQSDIKIKALQRKLDKMESPLEAKNVLLSGNNTEEVVKSLMSRDVPQIKTFMETYGKELPELKTSVINEILKQSYDPQQRTFSNWAKNFGTYGKQGNIRNRLEYLFGDKDKANKFVDLMDDIQVGVEAQKSLEQKAKILSGMTMTTMLFSLFTGRIDKKAALGAELGALTAVNIPRLIDRALQSKEGYKHLSEWAKGGFTAEGLKRYKSLYDTVMKDGDHYIIKPDGSLKLVDKKE